jgi:hypothetical protein
MKYRIFVLCIVFNTSFLMGCVSNKIDESKVTSIKTTHQESAASIPKKLSSIERTTKYFVTATTLNVRLAPSTEGKSTNSLDRGQIVEVYEKKNGWARISMYYNGKLEGVDGQVAMWVSSDYLSKNRPIIKKTVSPSSPIAKAIEGSDDYFKYRKIFLEASESLIDSGRCSLSEFKNAGGWVRSGSQKPRKVYFVFCGGYHNSNRLYLDVSDGSIFR